MIHPFNNETSTRWGRGEFRVQLERAGYSRPMGYCDGTDEDENELRELAETEGVDDLPIKKKPLKSGREIWILGEVPTEEEPFE